MFLFLDVISPIPEFHLINDKKIINSVKILEHYDEKLSDCIVPKYLEINKEYKINQNSTNLIITTGPGSYTALRVGASFISGLGQSLSLPVSTISNENIHQFLCIKKNDSAVYFESSNNQKFLTYKKRSIYFHDKIDSNKYNFPKHISSVYYNYKQPKILNIKSSTKSFSMKKIILKNLKKLKFHESVIIKPIYISNNNILN